MQVNVSRCDLCGVCISVCPVDVIALSEFKVTIDNYGCVKCDKCRIVCPAQAITKSEERAAGISDPPCNRPDALSRDVFPNNLWFNSQTIHKHKPVLNNTLPGIKPVYDVVVVGAGPGGSVAARFAAENNVSTLILERDREAGIPVRCAEGISGGGLEKFIDMEDRFIASKISKARLYTPNGRHLEMRSHVKGYVLERRVFDSALCDLACRKGAAMLTKADVTEIERTDDGDINVYFTYRGERRKVSCKVLIGADGVESRVGRWAGLNTSLELSDISTSVQYTLSNIDIDKEMISFYFGNKIAPGGYVWVFPKSNNTANVGIGVSGNFANEKLGQAYLDEFVMRHFPGASATYTVYGGVPIRDTLKEIVTDNVMLVGDAARQVNPVTGGGIKQAMIAGKIAGETASEAVCKKDYTARFLKKYTREWEKALGSKHRFIYKVKEKVLYAPDERLNKLGEICKGIPADKMSLTDLFKAVVKGEPKLVAEMASAFVLSKVNI